MSNEENKLPAGAWETGGKDFTQQITLNGRSDIGWGTVNTSDQRLYGYIHFLPYKLTGNDPSYDYYAFVGSMTHGVTTSKNNVFSVGYYATEMDLVVTCLTESSTVYQYGPDSTVGTNTTSFSIGAGLQGGFKGDEPTGTAGINASWGVSFASPDVSFLASRLENGVTWRCKLPCISFKSPGIPADPFPASAAGYTWKPALIVKVPKGKPPILEIRVRIQWNFDYTRGITNDVKSWVQTFTYNYQGVPSIKEGALIKGSRPEIYVMESGKRRSIPDPATFEARGYKWDAVIIISDSDLANIPLGLRLFPIALLKDGVLLQGSSPTIYVMESGKRRGITDPATFKINGFKWEDVKAIPDDELNNIPLGAPLSGGRDGALLKGSSPEICVMESGKRRSIPDPATFEARGYKWEDVVIIPDNELDNIPRGTPLPTVLAYQEKGSLLHISGTTSDGKLWHSIRFPSGSWSSFGDVEGQTGDRGFITDVALQGISDVIHLCAINSSGSLWHTIRQADGSWSPFVDVKVAAGNRGNFVNMSCAGGDGKLQVCAVTSDGNLWHTIRHA
ncbi:hypothetical protein, partial [Microcoleus sp. POL10_C6]|uniref:hypothetical protein n=1 Tax=Microcoleus sp. POL10_C6 TaxID=2818852 RepID=UPI002FD21E6A